MASNVQYFAQTVQTQTDGNSQQWKQAYDWGNHTVPGYITRVEWEYAPYIERNHPMLPPLMAVLNLDENILDQAFVEASYI